MFASNSTPSNTPNPLLAKKPLASIDCRRLFNDSITVALIMDPMGTKRSPRTKQGQKVSCSRRSTAPSHEYPCGCSAATARIWSNQQPFSRPQF